MTATLKTFLQAFEKTLERTLTRASPPTASSQYQSNRNGNSAPVSYNPNCFMCSEPGHGAKECEVTQELIRNGECMINPDGKIVLPNGQYVPRNIPGKNLRERFKEWHKRNRAPSPTTLMYAVAPSQTTPSTMFLGGTKPADSELTKDEQIQLLE